MVGGHQQPRSVLIKLYFRAPSEEDSLRLGAPGETPLLPSQPKSHRSKKEVRHVCAESGTGTGRNPAGCLGQDLAGAGLLYQGRERGKHFVGYAVNIGYFIKLLQQPRGDFGFVQHFIVNGRFANHSTREFFKYRFLGFFEPFIEILFFFFRKEWKLSHTFWD